mmetsp:Transcript_38732/g.92991  ORF Transcript_38732/g.92991 Transcript_38732/m.92991 type:complete len:425 (-) Transcript_38732:438-1712(-)
MGNQVLLDLVRPIATSPTTLLFTFLPSHKDAVHLIHVDDRGAALHGTSKNFMQQRRGPILARVLVPVLLQHRRRKVKKRRSGLRCNRPSKHGLAGALGAVHQQRPRNQALSVSHLRCVHSDVSICKGQNCVLHDQRLDHLHGRRRAVCVLHTLNGAEVLELTVDVLQSLWLDLFTKPFNDELRENPLLGSVILVELINRAARLLLAVSRFLLLPVLFLLPPCFSLLLLLGGYLINRLQVRQLLAHETVHLAPYVVLDQRSHGLTQHAPVMFLVEIRGLIPAFPPIGVLIHMLLQGNHFRLRLVVEGSDTLLRPRCLLLILLPVFALGVLRRCFRRRFFRRLIRGAEVVKVLREFQRLLVSLQDPLPIVLQELCLHVGSLVLGQPTLLLVHGILVRLGSVQLGLLARSPGLRSKRDLINRRRRRR